MLVQKVAAFIARTGMFAPSARVGVAVSGGADSVCLLRLLSALRSNWNLQLTVLHLNHCLRAEESDADEQFVRDLAASCGLPFRCERADVAREAARTNDNLEQAARRARRRFFRALMTTGTLDCVGLGHTKNDQAETVLFRMLRGAFTTGLSGMRPVTPDGFVRPILDLTRSEVETYLKHHGLTWREDSSNSDRRFARNRIRHDLIPMLEREWNPQLSSLFSSYARMAQDDEIYWNTVVSALEPELLTTGVDGATLADVRKLTPLSDAVLRRLVRRAIERIRGDLREIDYTHVAAMVDIVRQGEGHARIQVPGADILRSCDWIRFAPSAARPATRDYEYTITPPCSVPLPGSVDPIRLELIENSKSASPRDTLEARLDWAAVQSVFSRSAPLCLRNWRPGDSYQPIGAQEQKIKHLFQESRVPLWERRNWPILAAGSRILWSKGFGPAQQFAADSTSRLVLTIYERK